VVLTKIDLVETDWLFLVTEESEGGGEGNDSRGRAHDGVSAVTGHGLSSLIAASTRFSTAPWHARTQGDQAAIDRVFTMSGFGTVVTGTLSTARSVSATRWRSLPVAILCGFAGCSAHNEKVETVRPRQSRGGEPDRVEKSEISRR